MQLTEIQCIYFLSALEDIIKCKQHCSWNFRGTPNPQNWNLELEQGKDLIAFLSFFSLNPLHSFHWSFLLIVQNVSSDGFWILHLTTLIAGKKLYHILLDHVKSNNPRLQTFFFTTFNLVIFLSINQLKAGVETKQDPVGPSLIQILSIFLFPVCSK